MDKIRDFFSNEYEIPGKHGQYVKILTSSVAEWGRGKKQIKLFETNVSLFVNAAIIGFLYCRRAPKEISKEQGAKIAGTQMMSYSEEIKYVMRLILLLDEDYESKIERRLDKAFRYFGDNEEDIKRFEKYARGGIEVLYEKLVGDSSDPFEIADNLITFTDEIQSLFNEKVDNNDIMRLCNEFEGKQK